MSIPTWAWPRPPTAWDADVTAAFEHQYRTAVDAGPDQPVRYTLDLPRWQFLCYLGDHGRVLLHGSGNGEIAEFEPRLSNDVAAFGAQRGVYASSDGIWPLFFAVIDRDRFHGTMVNSCVRHGEVGDPAYYFSLDHDQLEQHPWRPGWIYLLPPDTFVREVFDQPPGDERVTSTQWCSPDPVVPLARLAVEPDDFPFLAQVRGHDGDHLHTLAAADPQGFPWPAAAR